MIDFFYSNFGVFRGEFIKVFRMSICDWVELNIELKESPESQRAIDVPKKFLCSSLLKSPNREFLNLCNRLFSKTPNLNKRTPHTYLANQIHGSLKEALHAKKLSINCDVKLIGDEFNSITKKRELYTKGVDKLSRSPDLSISTSDSSLLVHIKANQTFLKNKQLTFRGGSTTEYDEILSKKQAVHILFSPHQYVAIDNLRIIKPHILKIYSLPNPNDWGGSGAKRLYFKDSISDLIINY